MQMKICFVFTLFWCISVVKSLNFKPIVGRSKFHVPLNASSLVDYCDFELGSECTAWDILSDNVDSAFLRTGTSQFSGVLSTPDRPGNYSINVTIGSGCLQFYYWHSGGGDERLELWRGQLPTMLPNSINTWSKFVMPLAGLERGLELRAVIGNSSTGKVKLDDISLFNSSCLVYEGGAWQENSMEMTGKSMNLPASSSSDKMSYCDNLNLTRPITPERRLFYFSFQGLPTEMETIMNEAFLHIANRTRNTLQFIRKPSSYPNVINIVYNEDEGCVFDNAVNTINLNIQVGQYASLPYRVIFEALGMPLEIVSNQLKPKFFKFMFHFNPKT